MPSASYVMTNFQGGEVSPSFQGRMDDEDYKKSLALCLNYVPNQEGSLTARSGFKRIGMTKDNAPARLLPFRFNAMYPYVAEFTANFLRFWANGLIVLDNIARARLRSCSGSPPTFTIRDSRSGSNVVPPEWSNGDTLLVSIIGGFPAMANAGYLANRLWTLTIVSASAGTIHLSDAETGTPLSAAITLSTFDLDFTRVKEVATKYLYPEGVRQVQFTEQTITGVNGSSAIRATPPDHRVTYLYPLVSPQSISSTLGVQHGLIAENFIDGPYLDSVGTDIPLAVDGKTGTITATINGYDANIIYMKGDLMADLSSMSPIYYVSLQDNNKGHTPPALPGGVDAYWYEVLVNEEGWEPGDSYDIGGAVTALPTDINGVGTIYYSKIDANSGHIPASSPTQWSTTPPAWGALVVYAKRAVVTFGGATYLAITLPILGTDPATDTVNWILAPDIAAAVDEFSNQSTGWLNAPVFYRDDAGGSESSIDLGNPGRLIRLKAGPQPWTSKITYGINDLVNVDDVIYKSLIATPNLNHDPTTDATSWEIQTTTIKWTWGRITDAGDHYNQAMIEILGDDLPDDMPIWEFRMGVYSDSTGWPTCGAYHEGRLWLAGVMPNRLDAGYSNQGFNFTPTAPDGTVSDANAIAMTLNCEESETIVGLSSITEGLIAFTSESEWLISASSLNDPLTPTSVQARRTTAFSAFPTEVTRLPTGLAAIQKGGRRVLEYRNFVDMSSYQSRLNTSDFTRKCQHLTAGGIGMTQYQCISQPILWVAPSKYLIADWTNTLAHFYCPLPINEPIIKPSVASAVSGTTLFGVSYSRAPGQGMSYEAPFSFEHGRTLAVPAFQQVIDSIAIQRGPLETTEYLYAVVTGSDGKAHVEMMMPLFESTPLDDTLTDATTVATYGTRPAAFMVDSGVVPAGCAVANDGLSATFYGLMPLAGETVSFTIRGKYAGDVTISATGTVNVPFNTAFTIADLYLAQRGSFNYNLMPSGYADGAPTDYFTGGNGFQLFQFSDPTSFGSVGLFPVNFQGQFGYKYRRRGKMLRPLVGGANGPTFGKVDQVSRAAIYVDACSEIKGGTSFSKLGTIKLTVDGPRNVSALTPGVVTTGIYRGFIQDGNTFDGQICWEQTDPVPGNILAVGGFNAVEDT